MGRYVKFLSFLMIVLAGLSWGAWLAVTNTTRAWFEKDIRLRAELAVRGARPSLVDCWSPAGPDAIHQILADIAHDERIMAAAACDVDGKLLAATRDYPPTFTCDDLVGRHGSPIEGTPATVPLAFEDVSMGSSLYVNTVPLAVANKPLGFVVLVHDTAFIARRDAKVGQLVLLAFGVLSVCASLITIVAARLYWRGWTEEVRRFLRGGQHRREFQPIVRDVRDLIARLAAERALDEEGGLWTPQRLRDVLTEHLHGERIVILANREPYIHSRAQDGTIGVTHPASGLVTAMEPVMRACGGVWVAHGSGSADRDVVDANDRVRVPPGEESYFLRRVWLNAEQERGYYYGFANEGLWPLCHLAHTRPTFRHADWEHYQEVNRKFADALCEEVDGDDPIVLVQDYHFAAAPRMIRDRLPRATIITFWHVPWPNSERLGICPWRAELLQGMLGSSIMGFHTQRDCNNFFDGVDRYVEARIDREQHAVVRAGRRTLVRPYPISIEWPNQWAMSAPPVAECQRSVREELQLHPDALVGVGVDRLDYTKGIEERLWAVERLLVRHPEFHGRFTFVQLAAPSRTEIDRYRELNEKVESLAAQVNQRFAAGSYRPVILLRAHHEPPTVFRFYRAANLCYVSSLHDGMNLVAKEFVAAREDECGVLVLSMFTGAARELATALIVNPYDVDEASAAMAAALRMPEEEQRERMRAMRSLLAGFNVYRWAGRMLIDAAVLRRMERMTGRFAGAGGSPWTQEWRSG